MAKIGLNHHLCVARNLKTETRAVYQHVLGATMRAPRPETEIFTFEDGSGVGVSYIDPAQALTPEQHKNAIWLEFEVDDIAATTIALSALGLRPFDYFDKAHNYFQVPGGQVFRLTRKR